MKSILAKNLSYHRCWWLHRQVKAKLRTSFPRRSLLITDHNVERTLEVSDKAYIIDHGRVIAEGSPAQIVKNELVRKSYLGHTFEGDEFDDDLADRSG